MSFPEIIQQVVANLRMGVDMLLGGNNGSSTSMLGYGTISAIEFIVQHD